MGTQSRSSPLHLEILHTPRNQMSIRPFSIITFMAFVALGLASCATTVRSGSEAESIACPECRNVVEIVEGELDVHTFDDPEMIAVERHVCRGCKGHSASLFSEGKFRHQCTICEESPYSCTFSHAAKSFCSSRGLVDSACLPGMDANLCEWGYVASFPGPCPVTVRPQKKLKKLRGRDRCVVKAAKVPAGCCPWGRTQFNVNSIHELSIPRFFGAPDCGDIQRTLCCPGSLERTRIRLIAKESVRWRSGGNSTGEDHIPRGVHCVSWSVREGRWTSGIEPECASGGSDFFKTAERK